MSIEYFDRMPLKEREAILLMYFRELNENGQKCIATLAKSLYEYFEETKEEE